MIPSGSKGQMLSLSAKPRGKQTLLTSIVGAAGREHPNTRVYPWWNYPERFLSRGL